MRVLAAAAVMAAAGQPAAAEVLACGHHVYREDLHPRCGVDEILRPGLAALGILLEPRLHENLAMGVSAGGRPLVSEFLMLFPEGAETDRVRAALEGAGPELAELAEVYRTRVGRYFCTADRFTFDKAQFVAAGGAARVEVVLHLPYPHGNWTLVTLVVETCTRPSFAPNLSSLSMGREALASAEIVRPTGALVATNLPWSPGREAEAVQPAPGRAEGVAAAVLGAIGRDLCCPSAPLSPGHDADLQPDQQR